MLKQSIALDTKLKSDIAEHAVALELLKKEFNVLKPVGDRLAYDLVIEKNGSFRKIQVKSAMSNSNTYRIDTRRTQTNRRALQRKRYAERDFDFAIIFLHDINVFYILPFRDFNSFKSGIIFIEKETRQRKPRSFDFREAWHLLNI